LLDLLRVVPDGLLVFDELGLEQAGGGFYERVVGCVAAVLIDLVSWVSRSVSVNASEVCWLPALL